MNSRLDLDHVAVVVRDLDRAQSNYERLGFRLSPRSSHRGPVPPDGSVGPWGSGNHCAMFKHGYFEILGVTDPALYKAHLDRRLAAYEGLHLIAFGTDNADAAVDDLRQHGINLSDPQEIGRDVPYGAGTRPGRFAISNLQTRTYPEADYIVIEQMTRDVLWQTSLLDHPNGALSLEAVAVHATDPAGFRDRMAPLFASVAASEFHLSFGSLELVSAPELERLFPGASLPVDGPCVAAVTIGVSDLSATRRFLSANAVNATPSGRGTLFVGPEAGCGAIVEFAPSSTSEAGQ